MTLAWLKLNLNRLPTRPDDPPAAVLAASPTYARCPVLLAIDGAAAAEGDVLSPMCSPVTEPMSAAADASPRLMYESGRRDSCGPACSDMAVEIGQPDEDAGGRGDAEAAPSIPSIPGSPSSSACYCTPREPLLNPDARWSSGLRGPRARSWDMARRVRGARSDAPTFPASTVVVVDGVQVARSDSAASPRRPR